MLPMSHQDMTTETDRISPKSVLAKLKHNMSALTVDAKGKRVVSDILITGYIHEAANSNNMVIPTEIIGLILAFWFIDICDKWDESLCHKAVHIDGSCVKLQEDRICSIFGTESVEKGIFEWRLKYKTAISWCLIGIIKDDLEYLKKYQNSYGYALTSNGHLLKIDTGTFFSSLKNYYGRVPDELFTAKDTLITVTLNMDNKTIAYKINDNQYETKEIPDPIRNKYRLAYRLAVTMKLADMELDLL